MSNKCERETVVSALDRAPEKGSKPLVRSPCVIGYRGVIGYRAVIDGNISKDQNLQRSRFWIS